MISRRALFAAAGALASGACCGCGAASSSAGAPTTTSPTTTARWRTAASSTPRAGRTPTASARATSAGTSTGSGTTDPTTTVSDPATSATVETGAAAASLAQVEAEFGGRRPTSWGLHSPGTINRGSASAVRQGLVALTFDACGGAGGDGYDADLIALLRRLEVPATLTLNARWVRSHESIAAQLGSDPLFEIQSHGNLHQPLSVDGASAYGIAGTASVAAVYEELTSGTVTIQAVASNPIRFMRPGTAYCDDVAAAIGRRVGLPVLDFSVNGDLGATATAAQVVSNLTPLAGGDIVISHMNHPEHDTAEGYARALPTLLRKGMRFAHVSQVV